MHSRSPLENHTRFLTKMGNVYTPFSPKTRTDGAAHNYMASVGEYPPGKIHLFLLRCQLSLARLNLLSLSPSRRSDTQVLPFH